MVSLLTNCKLVRTPQTVTVNAEVASWLEGNAKSDYSSLPSMLFEDNVGEDGLSAQSSYTIDINDSNYIDNLAPDPTMFGGSLTVLDINLSSRIKIVDKNLEALANNFTGKLDDTTKDMSLL